VRWESQQVETDRTLPGYRDAVPRSFDAPEALDIRFWEVRAKSALNKVPQASQMPFRWTVNPYRGCTHGCTYCSVPESPILMADGTTKPIADLQAGDEIYGTRRGPRYRYYERTKVLHHWSTVQPAFRTVLADGTELITSGEHRFLTERGWKYVFGAYGRPFQRPHLTTNNQLRGTGQFASSVFKGPDYQRGYLAGMIRGDGTIGRYAYTRANGTPYRITAFRLALVDREALERADHYLRLAGVEATARVFAAATANRRQLDQIGTARRDGVERIEELIKWPLSPSSQWRAGFLAGIFDAEGSCGPRHELRISNTDPMILGWTKECLRHFQFDVRIDDWDRPNGLKCVRFVGGLKERLRFFHLTDPAITRKRYMVGMALKSDADLRVVAVEPLGVSMRMYDITTGTGDFIANGVVNHNCFARPTHKYLDFDAGRDFEREIVVKVNAPEVLRAQLSKPRWTREHVALGTNTDPYQWCEGRYKLMPGIWEALRDTDTPCSVLTKSPLLLRDVELMKELADRVGFHANLSIPTLDEKSWRETEPHTPHPRKRIEAVAELNRAGIPTGVLVAPLMPGINDDPAQVEEILDLCAEAGAINVGGICLHLRGEVRDVFMGWLRNARPDLVDRYEDLYARSAYAPAAEQKRVHALLAGRVWPESGSGGAFRGATRRRPAVAPPRRPQAPHQGRLF
jgi:DNA repair photolyase